MKLFLAKDIVIDRSSKEKFLEDYFRLEQPATFTEDGELQCEADRNRSIRDLTMLLNGEFEEPTSEEDCALLLEILLRDRRVRSLHCSTVKKLVYYSAKNKHGYWSFDEEGIMDDLSFSNVNDGWSRQKINELYNKNVSNE